MKSLAAIYGAPGQRDEAFAWLEKAFERRDINLPNLGNDPELDSLRQDSRMGEMLRRRHLAP